MANEPNDQSESAFQEFLTNAENLTQISIAIYDRLLHLRNNLSSITSRQDTPSNQQQSALSASSEMHPEHSAIVLSSEDEGVQNSETQLSNHIRELSLRLEEQARLIAAASGQIGAQSHSVETSLRNTNDLVQRLPRRNPSTLADLTNSAQSFSQALSARRNMLEATLRQLRRSSDPNDPSTSLGRRVMGRAAATAVSRDESSTSPDADILSTPPSGPDPRPNRPIEPRAATHLRHSFLPNPPPSVRVGVPRMLQNSRPGEYRPRITRTDTTTTQNVNTMFPQMLSEDESNRSRPMYTDSAHGSYRIRRRINSRGQEHVTSINWNDLRPTYSFNSEPIPASVPNPWTWTDSARRGMSGPQRTLNSESASSQASGLTDQAAGVVDSQRRRRGWARLDADGDEISTEDEELLERRRVNETHSLNPRRWNRSGNVSSSARVLDIVQHHTTTDYPDSEATTSDLSSAVDSPSPPMRTDPILPLLDELFGKGDIDTSYKCPLPAPLPSKSASPPRYVQEVPVTMNVDAGR